MRTTIKAAAPDAEERISYQMPTFVLNGTLIHFAAWKHHIGIYPVSSGIEALEQELSKYKCSKGAVQFPFDQPLPLALISKIVTLRVAENLNKAAAKTPKRKA